MILLSGKILKLERGKKENDGRKREDERQLRNKGRFLPSTGFVGVGDVADWKIV